MVKAFATKASLKSKTTATALGVIMCVVLPQLFHLIGAISGFGTNVGAAFLPMHLPVIFVGLLSGTAAGFFCGLLGPAVSMALSGMPTAAMLPFMTIELACYGLAAAFLSNAKMPTIVKVLIIQIFGRLVRALAIFTAIYIFGNSSMAVSQAWSNIAVGLPGIILQLCILPLIMSKVVDIRD